MTVAVDIGGTKTLVGLFDAEGNLERTERFDTPKEYEDFIKELAQRIQDLRDHYDIRAIGVAAPGVIDRESMRVRNYGRLGWQNTDLVGKLQNLFGLPVILENDAKAAAVYEARAGAGRGYQRVMYITISTGIGTGLAVDGHISHDMPDSEGGQIHFEHDGQPAEWEDYASGRSFEERFGMKGSECEDPKIWKEYAHDLRYGFEALIGIVQPDAVVVGGGMGANLAKFHDFLITELQTNLSPLIKLPPIVKAKEPNEAVLRGIYLLARDHATAG